MITTEVEVGTDRLRETEYRIDPGAVVELAVDADKIMGIGTSYDATEAQQLLDRQVGGVQVVGFYSHGDTYYPIVTFLYHKVKDDVPETNPRVVIMTGRGHGVHPEHAGQEPSDYLVGVQIGEVDEHGTLHIFADKEGPDQAKSFSTDCIWGGTRGYNPVLANGKGETY